MTSELALVVAFGAGLAVAATRVPPIWRGELRTFDQQPAWWLWGDALWRGVVRSLPAIIVGGAVWVASGLLLFVSPPEKVGPFERPLWAVLPILVITALMYLLVALVVLFNRPRSMVPPRLRGEPGALAQWKRALGEWYARRSGRH